MDVVYHLDSQKDFYAELDDQLYQPEPVTDPYVVNNIVNAFVGFLVAFQDDFLQTPADLAAAIYKLIDSPLYADHHDTIIPHLIRTRALISHNPRDLYIAYGILLYAGRDNMQVLREVMVDTTPIHNKARGKGSKLFAKLKHEVESFLGGQKMQIVAVELMFELCRVCRLGKVDLGTSATVHAFIHSRCSLNFLADSLRFSKLSPKTLLDIIGPHFIHHLLLLVESTGDDVNESFNYGVIKLLLAFNEQFMMIQAGAQHAAEQEAVISNPVLDALANTGDGRIFGQNIIFMINRTVETTLQLLILKLLYLIFTTPPLYEFFYTNDLCVLVDVFLRELCSLDDEDETLRQTYLRVLTPLLVNTQIRHLPYKREIIHRALLSLIANRHFVSVNTTTQRLVRRVLVDWWGGVCGGVVELENEEECVAVAGIEEKEEMDSGSASETAGPELMVVAEDGVDLRVVCA
ncbi:hypothetical protein BC937DRAFT_92077 [Endogone sp. FLAS-F59071]|nr:hypothetical protein BC937DRAFT_92077 [Endogone sp. FLAS-F59071]|eukprot:RUS15731.1 hypothetical protein BC937DRAFT_92077 [Endogone sp. FLAS-F59071]